jgi:hypothetical protein
MSYSSTLSLNCPHCNTKCQFVAVEGGHKICRNDNKHHIPYICTHCQGLIATRWIANNCNEQNFRANPTGYSQQLDTYYPIVGDWKPRVNLQLITNEKVRADFKEAINCYNNGFYNATMLMARRAIQQEMIDRGASGNNLYQQIESTGISEKLKSLLHKVKNFGNHGAHPDFCLYDEEGNQIVDKKEFSKLSLEFLDRYFADEYEIDSLVKLAPKSKKELEES